MVHLSEAQELQLLFVLARAASFLDERSLARLACTCAAWRRVVDVCLEPTWRRLAEAQLTRFGLRLPREVAETVPSWKWLLALWSTRRGAHSAFHVVHIATRVSTKQGGAAPRTTELWRSAVPLALSCRGPRAVLSLPRGGASVAVVALVNTSDCHLAFQLRVADPQLCLATPCRGELPPRSHALAHLTLRDAEASEARGALYVDCVVAKRAEPARLQPPLVWGEAETHRSRIALLDEGENAPTGLRSRRPGWNALLALVAEAGSQRARLGATRAALDVAASVSVFSEAALRHALRRRTGGGCAPRVPPRREKLTAAADYTLAAMRRTPTTMLRVLSFLGVSDLCAVARVSQAWRALLRTPAGDALWRRHALARFPGLFMAAAPPESPAELCSPSSGRAAATWRAVLASWTEACRSGEVFVQQDGLAASRGALVVAFPWRTRFSPSPRPVLLWPSLTALTRASGRPHSATRGASGLGRWRVDASLRVFCALPAAKTLRVRVAALGHGFSLLRVQPPRFRVRGGEARSVLVTADAEALAAAMRGAREPLRLRVEWAAEEAEAEAGARVDGGAVLVTCEMGDFESASL
jgi:hypothetical protein